MIVSCKKSEMIMLYNYILGWLGKTGDHDNGGCHSNESVTILVSGM